VIHDLRNLREKNEREMQSKMEGHSSRQEQAEDRISELKDEMVIQGKTEELLVRELKTCERNMKEFNNSIKRSNPRIMGVEEGEEGQIRGICNIFNKIVRENFPNIEKTMFIQVQEASRTPTRLDQKETPHDILSLKQQAQSIEKEY
jgi:septal ring factor EnvC (AmiA/AmiB activator)